MKKYSVLFSLIIRMISISIAQTNNLNNYTLKATTMTFQNVKTEAIDVGGTDFYYRKLGQLRP